MVVQYLVGLCCVRRNPDAVEVTVGDMVFDSSAQKDRDVDVTVAIEEEDGSIRAFKAYEVKREQRPLDVAVVEQLAAKLMDMPRVTQRAIVSASGYTEAAKAKAAARDVELYVFRRWDVNLDSKMPAFNGKALPMTIPSVSRILLHWVDASVFLYAPNGPAAFNWKPEDQVLSAVGAPHSDYKTIGEFQYALLLRSTEILCRSQPTEKIIALWEHGGPAVTGEVQSIALGLHTHTLNVEKDKVFLRFGEKLAQLHEVRITGELEWRLSKTDFRFHIVERVSDGEPYAGAAIAEYGTPDGRMSALVFSPESQVVGIYPVLPAERHLRALRRLKLLEDGHVSSC